MAANKKPGVTCKFHGAPAIDAQTNCRGRSPNPGVVSVLSHSLVDFEKTIVATLENLEHRYFDKEKAPA